MIFTPEVAQLRLGDFAFNALIWHWTLMFLAGQPLSEHPGNYSLVCPNVPYVLQVKLARTGHFPLVVCGQPIEIRPQTPSGVLSKRLASQQLNNRPPPASFEPVLTVPRG